MKRQYHSMLLSPTLSKPLWVGKQQQRRRSRTPVPLLLPGMRLWQPRGLPNKNQGWDQCCFTHQPSPSSKESKTQPTWQPALSFGNELSRLESWEQPAGFFPKSPVTKQLAGALREEIFSAATDQVATTQPLSVHLWHPACLGRNADSTPKAAPFQSTSFPSNSTGITIRYCNIIS